MAVLNGCSSLYQRDLWVYFHHRQCVGEAVSRAATSALGFTLENFIQHVRSECFPSYATANFRKLLHGLQVKHFWGERSQEFAQRLSTLCKADWWTLPSFIAVLIEESVFLPGFRKCYNPGMDCALKSAALGCERKLELKIERPFGLILLTDLGSIQSCLTAWDRKMLGDEQQHSHSKAMPSESASVPNLQFSWPY
jgi:hypothetical protein